MIQKSNSVKIEKEIAHINKAQICTETAMRQAINLIQRAEVVDGLLLDSGKVLTSERVRASIRSTLTNCGCALHDPIVSCGKDSAEPHNTGAGPLLADKSIVIDIFPKLQKEGYHADMSRTVVRGSPSKILVEMYEAVLDAQIIAINAVRSGVSGEDIHNIVCDLFDDRGYRKLFIHSTGHGVGLNIHEAPYISPGGEVLKAGNVITIEPGLYDPTIGGIRLEDLLVVTESGYKNLTKMKKQFILDI